MNFFETQQQAKRNTRRLIVYFCLAVLLIVTSVYFTVTLIFLQVQSDSALKSPLTLWNPDIFLSASAFVLLLVTLGSLYKIWMLRGGGATIATSLGGRLLNSSTTDPLERKILNVVEEISIASGLPVPPVYLLDQEEGINAFAAGYTPESAVIGVTNGCVRLLTRDELQGVMAHEFSHIINGDMRLNIRLIGLIHGILLLGLLGYFILRSMTGRRRYSSSKENNNNAGIALFGLALYIIGYVGVFFGNLIKAAVSREREFLADASAVQFTRHPDGIAGALKKIGGLQFGSHLESSKAQENSHLFFSNALSKGWFKLFATHPPLSDRIKRIDRHFDGIFPAITPGSASLSRDSESITDSQNPRYSAPLAGVYNFSDGLARFATTPQQIIQSIGNPGAEHLEYARKLLQQIPEYVHDNTHNPFGARAVIYSLLLDKRTRIRDKQLSHLNQVESPDFLTLLENFTKEDIFQDARFRLPLIDLCLPSLRQLGPDQYRLFKENLHTLVTADQEISLFEYTLHHILLRYCEANSSSRMKKYGMTECLDAAKKLLWNLSYAGHGSNSQRKQAFQEAWESLGTGSSEDISSDSAGIEELDLALEILAGSEPSFKSKLIEACVISILNDGIVSVNEAETLRAVCDAVHCPTPPIIAGQSV